MVKAIVILMSFISLTVVSQEHHDNYISQTIDGNQREINRTCYCTQDEQCDSNTSTCRITNTDHVCYESWTKTADSDVLVTAGYEYVN